MSAIKISTGTTTYAVLSVETPVSGPAKIVARSERGSVRRFTRKQLGSARFYAAVSQHIAAVSAARNEV